MEGIFLMGAEWLLVMAAILAIGFIAGIVGDYLFYRDM